MLGATPPRSLGQRGGGQERTLWTAKVRRPGPWSCWAPATTRRSGGRRRGARRRAEVPGRLRPHAREPPDRGHRGLLQRLRRHQQRPGLEPLPVHGPAALRHGAAGLGHRAGPAALGQCTYGDFAQACRRWGFLGSEGQLFWSSLRPDGNRAPLKFFELDPEETANLEQLETALWDSCNFDLDKAWARVDTGNKAAVSEAEFKKGLRSLGFQGNAKLLFHGLDSTAVGRLTRPDFDYLKLLSRLLMLSKDSGSLKGTFSSWVDKEFGGVPEFLSWIELPERGTGGQRAPGMTAKALCEHIRDLGFEGDAHALSTLAVIEAPGAW
eukprot:SRR837773.19870.p1 GENE.SRR837773.19870~~SRR837773.19870.p1  ORF type:complete len:324 (-),score=75.83 SRR837773.19870:155-1126(-)